MQNIKTIHLKTFKKTVAVRFKLWNTDRSICSYSNLVSERETLEQSINQTYTHTHIQTAGGLNVLIIDKVYIDVSLNPI